MRSLWVAWLAAGLLVVGCSYETRLEPRPLFTKEPSAVVVVKTQEVVRLEDDKPPEIVAGSTWSADEHIRANSYLIEVLRKDRDKLEEKVRKLERKQFNQSEDIRMLRKANPDAPSIIHLTE